MRRHVLSFLLIFWICASSCFSQLRPAQNHPGEKDRLKRFLQQYLRDSQTPEDNTTRYTVAFVDLKDNGAKDVIVYITGQRWCGSGGCTTLVLAPVGSSYGVNSKIVVTRPPIRVLPTKSHGWHDIAVRVQGGGDVNAYEVKLTFDGKSYPISPSHHRGRRLENEVLGREIIPVGAEGELLY